MKEHDDYGERGGGGRRGKGHGVLAIMLGEEKPHSGGDGGDGGEHEEDGLDIASEEVLDAMHSKDPKALKDALSAFVKQCMADYGKEERDEGEAAE
jgi:hypothetical protein